MSTGKPFWTIGRAREKAHTAKFVKDAKQQALIFSVIDAALDINEGGSQYDEFIDSATIALIEGNSAVWENAANWVRKIGDRYPVVLGVWDRLVVHKDWRVRWRVACLLYVNIPGLQSDNIFAVLRHDKSAKVRQYATIRYENRPGLNHEVVFKMFDASDASSPGFRRGS